MSLKPLKFLVRREVGIFVTQPDDESDRFDVLASEIRKDDTRITELADMAASETRANAARAEAGVVEVRTAPAQVEDPPVYVPSGGNGNSYFRKPRY